MSKTVAIVQSCYVPWKGYFDLIAAADEFVLYDDAQYTRQGWRNRNMIKTPAGPAWLTIPVERGFQPIKDTRIADPRWSVKHWKSIRQNYAGAAHFGDAGELIGRLYAEVGGMSRLSDVNYHFLAGLCAALGIATKLTWSMDYELLGDRSERLANLCRQAGATRYLSGPAARAYLDLDHFARAGISVSFFDYSDYREYRQLFPPFVHNVSMIDLLLNEGFAARSFMKVI
jgi:hypothetical protein